MRTLTTFEIAAAFVVLFLVCAIIIALIALSFKLYADARIEQIEQSVNRRADKLARQMMHERLDGLQIVVTQRIAVVEDDLKNEPHPEKSKAAKKLY